MQLNERQLIERQARDAGASASFAKGWKTSDSPERDALARAVGDCSGGTVLDAGCGFGKMTPVLRRARRIMALDFSWGVLRLLRSSENVHRVQGNVCSLPFRDRSFDMVMSAEVLEHLPSPQLRAAFFAELYRVTHFGGKVVITTYNWKGREGPKEGMHDNGIYYYRYDAEELGQAASRWFIVRQILGVACIPPKTHRLFRALGAANIYWDRLWRRTGIGRKYGHLLLAHLEKATPDARR